MFDRATFIVRVAEDANAPRVRVRDCVRVDPDEPAAQGRRVAVRDPGRGGREVFPAATPLGAHGFSNRPLRA